MLPEEFITYTRSLFGEERWQRYLDSFSGEEPVSIRLNPYKQVALTDIVAETDVIPVPWCRNAYYLKQRPDFTLDPLLHAGAYYVQEAGSMFLDMALQQYLSGEPLRALDLCAAPGGKSTLLRAALPEGSLLMSNEPDRRRANILMENMQKQGHPDVIVTNNYPINYQKTGLVFDLILTDVPCSGEGMFRRSAIRAAQHGADSNSGAIAEWSLQNVMKCAELQRSIVEDIWPCLKPGGILIYSTCTFNLREDEENVRWIAETLGADILPVDIKEEWKITGSLLPDWHAPVYRFIPGTTEGEGLFMAVLRKYDDGAMVPTDKGLDMTKLHKALRILSDGNPQPERLMKGKKEILIPTHAEALLVSTPKDKYPRVELSREDALRYLRHEALVLPPDTPTGFVIVTYRSVALGFVKNIGNRANNMYPQEWKIRTK